MVIILTVSINELMKSKVVYFIWVIGVYIVESGMLLLLPTGYSKCYGERNLVFVFAIVQCLAVFLFKLFAPFFCLNKNILMTF